MSAFPVDLRMRQRVSGVNSWPATMYQRRQRGPSVRFPGPDQTVVGQDRRYKWSNGLVLADVPPSPLNLIPRQVGKQGNDDCSGGHIAQDCGAHAVSIGVYLENARRSVEG